MLKPLDDRIVIEVIEEQEQTVGGIVLANNAKQEPQSGKVVAVGEGTLTENGTRIPVTIKVDDVVIYDKYAGSKVDYNGQEYLIMHAKDIMAIVD